MQIKAVWAKIKEKRLRTAVIIIVFSLLFLGLADFFIGPRQLSAYGNKWNDISDFRSALISNGYRTASIISTPLAFDAIETLTGGDTVLVIIGVERPYLDPEIGAIIRFVERGGFVLLADDFGYGSAVGEKLAGVAFSGKRLYSAAFDRNPAFVKVNTTIDSARYNLIFNTPTVLERVSGSEVRAFSYADSWLDENGNGERDLDEESNPYPMIAKMSRGDGDVVAVSDPGLFINDMWSRSDNARYVLAAAKKFFPGAKTFVFDETRHKPGTIREGGWRTGTFIEISVLGNWYGRVGISIVLLIALAAGTYRVKTPAEWRHEDTLAEISLYHLATSRFEPQDRHRLRLALLHKLRLQLNMYPEEFDKMDPSNIRSALGDERLCTLVEDPDSVPLEELDGLTDRVRAWRRT